MVGAPDVTPPPPHLNQQLPEVCRNTPTVYTVSDGKGSDTTLSMLSLNSAVDPECKGGGGYEDPEKPTEKVAHQTNPEKQPLSGQRVEEKWWTTLTQVAIPFFIAGVGTIAAGVVLGIVMNWPVFQNVSAIFVLVPALSGLKGNLDMCLASRLSTQANLGNMNSVREIVSMVVGNISLVQVQAIVAACIVAAFAIVANMLTDGAPSLNNALLLCSAAIFTATTTCFVLDFVMVLVILGTNRFNINPDNVATPLAASIGDVVSNSVLAVSAQYMYDQIATSLWQPIILLIVYFAMLPFWVFVVLRNKYTRPVLTTGWVPVISALFLSGIGGMILDMAVDQFNGFVVFHPIINGIGGNLVSVQSSRISTHLHQTAQPGVVPENTRIMEWPWKTLFFGTTSAKIARMLILLAILGQVVFMFVADYFSMGRTTIGVAFGFAYVICATLQVMVLLHIAHMLIHFMWKRKKDPDNSAIPYLTALGDLLGSIFLGLAFFMLLMVGQEYGV